MKYWFSWECKHCKFLNGAMSIVCEKCHRFTLRRKLKGLDKRHMSININQKGSLGYHAGSIKNMGKSK